MCTKRNLPLQVAFLRALEQNFIQSRVQNLSQLRGINDGDLRPRSTHKLKEKKLEAEKFAILKAETSYC